MPELISYTFDLEGVTCSNCTDTITQAVINHFLNTVEYQDIVANPVKKTLRIRLQQRPCPEQNFILNIENCISDIGYAATLRCNKKATRAHAQQSQLTAQQVKIHKRKAWLGIGVGFIFVILSFFSFPLPFLIICCGLSIFLTIYLGWQFYKDAYKKLVKAKTLTMDSLFAISTITVITVMVLAFFIPWLPMMFETGVLIFGFRHCGIAIKSNLLQQINPTFSFRELACNQKIKVLKNQSVYDCDVDDVLIKDVVIIDPGQVIPFNCYYTGDHSIEIDNSNIDGDSAFPTTIHPGDLLIAGMKLPEWGNAIQVVVNETFENSYLSVSDRELADAGDKKTHVQSFINMIMRYFIPFTLLFAVIATILISAICSPMLGIMCGITFLGSVCPCTVSVNAPLTTATGVIKGARHAVNFKTAKGIKNAAKITDLVLDINGTRTHGKPKVKSAHLIDERISPQEFWNAIIALEKTSQHSFAKAIIDYTEQQQIAINSIPCELDNEKSEGGVCGIVDNQKWAIGNTTFFKETLNLDLSHYHPALPGQRVIFIARNGIVSGYLTLFDPKRKDMKKIVAELQQQHINVHICTGADEADAHYYAHELGIPFHQVQANCRAATNTKSAYIKKLQQKNKIVAMVGDGPNDFPAFKQADVSMIIQSPNTKANLLENADIVIQHVSLKPLLAAVTIARQTEVNKKQNLGISLIYNVAMVAVMIGLLLTLGICLPPSIGVALMIIQSSLVLLNIYRLKNQEIHPRANSICKENTSYQQILTQAKLAPALIHGTKKLNTKQEHFNKVFTSSRKCMPYLHEKNFVPSENNSISSYFGFT